MALDSLHPRLPAPKLYPLFDGPFRKLFLRPWMDALALRLGVSVAFPAMREAGRIVERENPGREGQWDRLLELYREQERALMDWETVFFPEDSQLTHSTLYDAGSLSQGYEERLQAELRRQKSSRDHVAFIIRNGFRLSRGVPLMDWDIPTPEETLRFLTENPVVSSTGCFGGEGQAALPDAKLSAPVLNTIGQERWMQMPSRRGGTQWIRIFEPEGQGNIPLPTILYLQGLCVEQDQGEDRRDPFVELSGQGYRILRVQQPGHGFRKPLTHFAGQQVVERGPMGFALSLWRWVEELSDLFLWLRHHGVSQIGFAGISLGAMAAQLYVAMASQWPRSLSPDALLLMTTTGRVVEAATRGSLARELGVFTEMERVGWTSETCQTLSPCLDPCAVLQGVGKRNYGDLHLSSDQMVFLLGQEDRLTSFDGGLEFAEDWRIPGENRFFAPRRGHLTAVFQLLRHPEPIDRFLHCLDRA
ncbi:hypothetical protein [Kiloniella sp. b19]|uniref:hypothetical protein n=1 Tax=Kiloniella sp. GXU_MW_B19 TaxID=3141326 RepID=UPI0031E06B67